MIFVKPHNRPSAILRADQIADKLGAKVYLNELPDDVSHETVVFVKEADASLVVKAKEQGAKIVYDPIDKFAYIERHGHIHWYVMVDEVICFNKTMAEYLKQWFKSTVIIPHQWDARLKAQAQMVSFIPGYIGHGFNCPPIVPWCDVSMVCAPELMLSAAPAFNCHVSIRGHDKLQAQMKPATKVSLAASVGAVCITSRDDSVIELLPDDYPYWCDSSDDFQSVLHRAARDFQGPEWNKALRMLAVVKEKTSLDTVANLYRQFNADQQPTVQTE